MKLSPTMQGVMDKLRAADWYYKHDGKECRYFATETGERNIGFERSAIVEGGYIYSRMDSKTLEALRKRGLIEVFVDGKNWLDVVKVVGMELPPRLEKALMVNITKRYPDNPTWKPQQFVGYAVSEAAVQHLIAGFSGPAVQVEVEVVGEVALDVWDYFKNK